MLDIQLDSRISLSKDQVSCEMDSQAIILQVREGVYYGLDEVGASIWRLIQSPKSVQEIVTSILNEFDVDRARCESDVRRILAELAEKNLVQINDGPAG